MTRFCVHSPFEPAGDQPAAIDALAANISAGQTHNVLLGVTGSGKTFTMAKTIERLQRPALVISHNKTLAAQLYEEFKELFPDNAVEYFVSYYDFYQPEAYIPQRDIYIEKDASRNDDLDRLRLAATASLACRKDVIIVASVSCIFGLGSPAEYLRSVIPLEVGQEIDRNDMLLQLVALQYERNDIDFQRSRFRVRGDTVDLYPAYEEFAYQIEFFGDTIEAIRLIHPTTGEELSTTDQVTIYPAVHYVVGEETIERSVKEIKRELAGRVIDLKNDGKLLEAQRLSARTKYDMEMMQEVGYCPGVENYSRYFDGRAPGSKPYTLLDYFDDDYLLFIDESHVTLPQIRAMYNGDQARKGVLVDHGFRLPSALDNRPLKFEEFESMKKSTTYVSATPSDYELTQAGGDVVELVIRPTGLLDPEIEVRPATGQVADILKEIALLVADGYRVLITALTKRLSEDLSDYVRQQGFRCQYLHSEVDTLERVEILKQLREGKFDVLIGVNLLREGLDLPEVALVAVLDADKQGFLRSETALIQTIGRCARNASGRVILYGDTITPAMKSAIGETNRRRQLQTEYNEQHGITPTTIQKAIRSQLSDKLNARKTAQAALHASDDEFDRTETITELEHAMLDAAENLEFEKAARLRDRINELKNPDAANDAQATGGYQEPLKTTRGKKGGNARHIPDDTQ
ncbi:MAG: excinuclease ABC subunit UvrB [Phycisphaerales bacterium]|jgi:excinuclease ABC subunit B|nr:excinuclease ABC subunit UvrB [Phycisphaerales bacterium]